MIFRNYFVCIFIETFLGDYQKTLILDIGQTQLFKFHLPSATQGLQHQSFSFSKSKDEIHYHRRWISTWPRKLSLSSYANSKKRNLTLTLPNEFTKSVQLIWPILAIQHFQFEMNRISRPGLISASSLKTYMTHKTQELILWHFQD